MPQQSQNKSLYTQVQGHGASGAGAITVCIQVQKGGEVPTQGLRMQAPDKKGEKKYFQSRKNIISLDDVKSPACRDGDNLSHVWR